jgi:hypothetical protein
MPLIGPIEWHLVNLGDVPTIMVIVSSDKYTRGQYIYQQRYRLDG